MRRPKRGGTGDAVSGFQAAPAISKGAEPLAWAVKWHRPLCWNRADCGGVFPLGRALRDGHCVHGSIDGDHASPARVPERGLPAHAGGTSRCRRVQVGEEPASSRRIVPRRHGTQAGGLVSMFKTRVRRGTPSVGKRPRCRRTRLGDGLRELAPFFKAPRLCDELLGTLNRRRTGRRPNQLGEVNQPSVHR